MFVNTPLACGCFFCLFFLRFVFALSFIGIFKGPKKNVQKKGNTNAALKIKAMQICAHPPFVGNNPPQTVPTWM